MFALLHNVCALAVRAHWLGEEKRSIILSVSADAAAVAVFIAAATFHTSNPLHRIGFLRCVLKIVSRVSFRFRDRDSGF